MEIRHGRLPPTRIITDPKLSAKQVGLRYVSDESPGIRREKSGKGFRFIQKDGKVLSDSKQLGRIKSLVIPPAWNNVWICPFETDICKQPVVMNGDASSIVIIGAGVKLVMKRNLIG